VWRRITDELGINAPEATATQPTVNRFDPERRVKRQRSRRRSQAWQWIGPMALAASAVLAVALWHTQQRLSEPSFDVVSVVSDAENNPLWVISASLQQQTVQITALAPPAIEDNQDHQLWLVKPNDEGVSSLGILPRNSNVTVINNVDLLREDAVAFAVSLEPLGGSPEPVPTGPVLFQAAFNTVQKPVR
jgi:anti-sigma-K factor RskA